MVLIPYQFDVAAVNLILKGLGKLPHEDVRTLIDSIEAHANATLNPPAPPKATRKRRLPAPGEQLSMG